MTRDATPPTGPALAALYVLLAVLASTTMAHADYVIHPLRVDEPISIDGRLDEPAWIRATPITEFTQMIPFTGEPITERTEVRIAYDDRNLYLAYKCYDSDMSKAIINEMRRDSTSVRSGDHAFVFIDGYNDRNTAQFFRFNALGGMEDTAVSDAGNTLNGSWDAVWECQGQIREDHWTAEVAIPFSQLRFREQENMTWAINVGRDISRNREISTWSPAPGGYGPLGKYRPAYFGEMVGITGVSALKNLEVVPYVSPGWTRVDDIGPPESAPANDADDYVLEFGVDTKYGITSNVTADLTYNTDFAQVEADEQQINLTRFDLFFPEKRPFFMEGAGQFDFNMPLSAGQPPPMLMFYSRRIGLAEDRAVPIILGAKITGKAGPYGIGLLNVVTDRFQAADANLDELRTNNTVLRLTRDVSPGSSVGLIAVNRQDTAAYNRGLGLDFSLRPRGNVDVRGLWARTYERPAADGARNAFYLGADWTTQLMHADVAVSDIGDAFNPGLGFVHRSGVRRARGGFAYTPWPRKWGIRSVALRPDVDFRLTRDNDLATRVLAMTAEAELEAGWRLGASAQRTAELLADTFDVFGATIPAGEYHYTSGGASLDTPSSRIAEGGVRVDFGEFFNGDRWGVGLNGSVRPTVRLMVAPFVQHNHVTLTDNEFDATILGGRLAYSFSPRLYTRLFAQWNNDVDEIASNLLVNWIYRPGSDLYIVVNQTAQTSPEWDLSETIVLGKLTYWWSR